MDSRWNDPKMEQLGLPERMKLVAKWHFRGSPARLIAEKTGLSMDTVKKYLKYITERIREFDDLDAYLKDLIARTGEELAKYSQMEAELWQMHEWASKPVVKVDNFGNPIPVRDHQTGEPIPGQFEIGPNKPGYIPIVVGQMSNLLKQRAELLKLIGPKVDVSVNLQFQLEAQNKILQLVKESAPSLYSTIYNELHRMAETHKLNNKEVLALRDGTPEIIDAEYTEADESEISV